MITGIIVMGFDSGSCGYVEDIAAGLSSRGHRNVRTAYHRGGAPAMSVLEELAAIGADPVAVIPAAVSEGRLTVDLMPADLGMCDNSVSFTRVAGREVAIRFMTALAGTDAMTQTLISRARAAGADGTCGILLLRRGSGVARSARDSGFHAEGLRRGGFPMVAEASVVGGPGSVSSAASALSDMGASRTVILPMMLSVSDHTAGIVEKGMTQYGKTWSSAAPLGAEDDVVSMMESKIPEGWRIVGVEINGTEYNFNDDYKSDIDKTPCKHYFTYVMKDRMYIFPKDIGANRAKKIVNLQNRGKERHAFNRATPAHVFLSVWR